MAVIKKKKKILLKIFLIKPESNFIMSVILPYPYQLINQVELSVEDSHLRFCGVSVCFLLTTALLFLHRDVLSTASTNLLIRSDEGLKNLVCIDLAKPF